MNKEKKKHLPKKGAAAKSLEKGQIMMEEIIIVPNSDNKKDWVSQRVKTKNRAPKVKSELSARHSTHPFLKATKEQPDRGRTGRGNQACAHQDGSHQPSLSRSPGQPARPGTEGEGAGEGAL